MNHAQESLRRFTQKSPTPKALLALTASDLTGDIQAAARVLRKTLDDYDAILADRRDDATTQRDRSKRAAASAAAEIKLLEDSSTKHEALLDALTAQAKIVLGEEKFAKLLEGRASEVKTRPTLPLKMSDVKGGAIRSYITHAVPKAEGSNAAARRGVAKAKIYGGGGHGDRVPEASEIGSGM